MKKRGVEMDDFEQITVIILMLFFRFVLTLCKDESIEEKKIKKRTSSSNL